VPGSDFGTKVQTLATLRGSFNLSLAYVFGHGWHSLNIVNSLFIPAPVEPTFYILSRTFETSGSDMVGGFEW
jgi:hypothetical protein